MGKELLTISAVFVTLHDAGLIRISPLNQISVPVYIYLFTKNTYVLCQKYCNLNLRKGLSLYMHVQSLSLFYICHNNNF